MQVLDIFARTRASFPGAAVGSSTFDAFAARVLAADAAGTAPPLPEVDAEFGDVWIHGIASDALKTAQTRALARAATGAGADARTGGRPTALFFRHLLKLTEHTWSCDVKECMPDNATWATADLAAALAAADPRFAPAVSAWEQQRAYVERAVLA